MSESLQDQVAVVTGASSGIGLAIAHALAAEGAQLVLGARSQPKLDEAVATLGEAAIAVRTDVTDTVDVEALIGTAIGRHGRIDILIANAGVYAGGDFADAIAPGVVLNDLWKVTDATAVEAGWRREPECALRTWPTPCCTC